MIFVALPLAVLILGKKTLYLPVRVDVYNHYDENYPEGHLNSTVWYRYDVFNHLTKMVHQNKTGTYGIDVECDLWGNVLYSDGSIPRSNDLLDTFHRTNSYTWNGKLLCSSSGSSYSDERHYDLLGRLSYIKRIRGNTTALIKFTHDIFGNLITSRYYKVNGETETLYTYTEFSYNWLGKPVTETRYDANGSCILNVDYSYEGSHTVAHVTGYSGSREYSSSFTFDHAGNLISRGSDAPTVTYTYTYKVVRIPFFINRSNFVYHQTLPDIGLGEWYN